MFSSVKTILKEKKNSIVNYSMRKRLTNKDFSIISNNCWGGQVYQDLGLEYKTPFVGLFLYAPCYIKMLKRLRYYLELPLVFVEQSKYDIANEARLNNKYPIGMLGDIEIHFLHYQDEVEAKEKWNRRLKRINWDNLFIKFCDRDLCTYDLLKEFDELDFEHKVCFTAKHYPNLKSTVWFKEFKDRDCVEPELKIYKKYFDVVSWLNQKKLI